MKIAIIEHSGVEHVTEVETYNAAQTFQEIKAAQSTSSNDYVVLIGDVMIDTRSVRTVTVVPDETTPDNPAPWEKENQELKKELEQTKSDFDQAIMELTLAMGMQGGAVDV